MTTAFPVIGFTGALTVNDGESSAQQAFKFPLTIGVPSGDVGKVEVTYLGQANTSRQYLPTLIDPGTLTCNIEYCQVDYARLVALQGVSKTWVVTAPNDGTGVQEICTYTGWVSKFPSKFEREAIVEVEFEVQLTGAVAFTTSS